MAVMFKAETKTIIEGLLFVANEPLSSDTIATIIELDKPDVEVLVNELAAEYQDSSRGMQIIEIAGGYQMVTVPELASYIERLYRPHSTYGLSRAALETLAIVAYKQPIARGEIEVIRGVKVDRAITTLMEKGLVKEVGRMDGPGRPILFGVTDKFLEHFGLKNLDDLPSLEELIVQIDDENLTIEVEEKVDDQE